MKNLKKVGAVALAAVMAVTFAPVASLEVFAANVGVNDKNEITLATGAASLDKGGDYTVGSTSTTATTLEIKAAGTYNIDLKDNQIGAVTVDSVGATVNIKASDSKGDGNTTIGRMASLTFNAPQAGGDISTVNFDGGKVTGDVTVNYGNLVINGGQFGGDIKFADGENATESGATAVPQTVASSKLTITGGEFAGTISDSATYLGDGTTTHNEIKVSGGNNDILKAASITGGVFASDPTALVWCGSNASEKMETKMVIGSTAIAKLQNAYKQSLVGEEAADVWAVGNETINAKIAKTNGSGDASKIDVEVTSGAVALVNVRDGVTAKCASDTTSGNADGKSLSVSPKSDLSMYHETKTDKPSDANKTITDWYYVGDAAIAGGSDKGVLYPASGLKKVGWDHDNADAKVSWEGTFKNGGNTNEVDVDGDKFVVDEAAIVAKANTNLNVKTVYVDCINDDGDNAADITFDGIKNATVTADKKYTVLTGSHDGSEKTVEVLREPQLDAGNALRKADDLTEWALNGNDITVEQLGLSDIGVGAHGVLIVNMGASKKSVKTTDKTLPLSYTTKGGTTKFYVGDSANQIASGSTTGQQIVSNYAVEKDTSISDTDKLNAGDTMTFVQGGITLPEVTPKKIGFNFNKDDKDTAIIFVDGAELGITKTPKYTTNEYGVSSVSSVDVTIGSGANVPTQVYRFKNIATGVHLYTINADEIATLTKSGEWKLENAQAFKVLPYNTTVAGAVPVRRYMNVHTGEFLYSTDVNGEQKVLDKSSDWLRQGIAFCGVAPGKGYAITRVRNTIKGDHVYSTSYKGEVEPLLTKPGYEVDGWPFEAVDIPANEK